MELKCLVKTPSVVGECPTWCEQKNILFWVDIQGKKVHRYHPDTGQNETFNLPEIVTAIAVCEDPNKALLSMRKTVALYDLSTQELDILATLETDQVNNRFNDAKCDPQGRFWPGSMNNINWSSPDGNLYCFSSATQYTKVQTQVTCSNGMGWSPDNKTMYFTDSFRYTVFAFDYDLATGKIANRRPFVVLDPKGGAFPDGLTVDSEGFVWSAHVGLGQIVRYDPTGKQERVIQLPIPRATSCTFGGPEMKTLYITSATETMTQDQIAAAPLSGSLFAIETEVIGLKTNRIPQSFYKPI
jgi:sugar lactone lactonase YvrE